MSAPSAPSVAPREKREPKSTRVSGTSARMPDWYYEERPCALSRPRFVRVPIRDRETGVIIQPVQYRMKRISDSTCESELPASGTFTFEGKIFHLCRECGPAAVRTYMEADEPVEQIAEDTREWAFPPAERVDERTILVRLTSDTNGLRDAMVARGFVARAKDKLVRKAGFRPVRVATFVRPA